MTDRSRSKDFEYETDLKYNLGNRKKIVISSESQDGIQSIEFNPRKIGIMGLFLDNVVFQVHSSMQLVV